MEAREVPGEPAVAYEAERAWACPQRNVGDLQAEASDKYQWCEVV